MPHTEDVHRFGSRPLHEAVVPKRDVKLPTASEAHRQPRTVAITQQVAEQCRAQRSRRRERRFIADLCPVPIAGRAAPDLERRFSALAMNVQSASRSAIAKDSKLLTLARGDCDDIANRHASPHLSRGLLRDAIRDFSIRPLGARRCHDRRHEQAQAGSAHQIRIFVVRLTGAAHLRRPRPERLKLPQARPAAVKCSRRLDGRSSRRSPGARRPCASGRPCSEP